MYRFLVSAAVLSLAFMPVPGDAAPQSNVPADMKLTDEQCVTIWKRAHASSGADVQAEEIALAAARPYLKDADKVNLDGNGTISTQEWASACKAGLVMSTPAVPAQP